MIDFTKYENTDIGKNAIVLYEIVSGYTNSCFVDLGVRSGISSEIFLIDSEIKHNEIFGIDVDFSLLKEEVNIHKNYTKILGDSSTIGKYWKKEISGLFIDTFHIKEQVLCELFFWYSHIKEGGFIAFHDTNWPDGKHDTYGGIVWDRVEEAIKLFFGIDTLNYVDEFIDVKNHPESWGMTTVKIKQKKNYVEQLIGWEDIFKKRNKLISLFWNENNKSNVNIELVLNV